MLKDIEVKFMLSDFNENFKLTIPVEFLGVDRKTSYSEIENSIYNFIKTTPVDIEEFKFV